MNAKNNWSRRNFIQTISGTMPTLALMLHKTPASAMPQTGAGGNRFSDKFIPLDLSRYFTASPSDFGPRQRAKELSREAREDGLIRVPAGQQTFRGIPFVLGPEGVKKKSWVVLSTRSTSWIAQDLEIPLQQRCGYVCLAHFCDWDENETPSPGEDAFEKVGQRLADVVMVYEDNGQKDFPIRRRFEVNSPSTVWGHLSFVALPHRQDGPRLLTDPLPNAKMWGDLQTGVWDSSYPSGPALPSTATLWVCALENPFPDRTLRALRLRASSDELLAICGVTVFQGRENPLRTNRLSLYRLTLPEAGAEEKGRWEVGVDLGVVARTYALGDFKSEAWLKAPSAGLGERNQPIHGGRHLYAEVSASPEATLWLRDIKSGKQYEFDLAQVVPGREQEARVRGARIEILEPEKVWLHGHVLETSTQRPTPVRLAFLSENGRYIPPYGHRTEVNEAWFQGYGADIKLMDSSFAYVDGTFQIELPVGEVYLEMSKGFEYEAVRRKVKIEPGQRELKLEISRFTDLRSQGWVSADTHVHFLSPSTALLEGQAEGLNLINLLAAQWGDLFTNVGDLSHGPISSRDGEMLVWVGTENRQHILGHLGLLGGHGEPVYPMSASGPGESYIGDPLWNSLSDWADACRQREGLVVAVHFPYPTAELAADIVLDKIDAVELYPRGRSEHFNNLRFLDWYRYLNCGYRLPVVGGTDKMGAWIPCGANRAYAYLGQEEFNFANWAKAVRSGNTFMTTGPLLFFQAEGKSPGAEITLGTGGAMVEVKAEVKSFVPVHRLEIVLNGQVVASREESSGVREMTLREKVRIAGPGWLAARCASSLSQGGSLQVAAHSSAVYVRVPGQDFFSATTAAYLLTLIEGAETWVRNLATRPDPERFARIIKIFADASERLHRRMHEHRIRH
jgi:hypothetical protein